MLMPTGIKLSFYNKKMYQYEKMFLRVCRILENSPSPLLEDKAVGWKSEFLPQHAEHSV